MSYRTDGYIFPQTGSGIDGYDKIISAQGALGLFAHGGDLILRSGDGYADGYDGYDGYLRLQTGSSRDIVTLDGYNISLFKQVGSYGSGKGVLFMANANTTPTSSPSAGGQMYAQDGDGYWRNPLGHVQSVSNTRIVRSITSDANYTAVQSDYQANIMEFTSSVTLTATRNVVVPIISGYKWIVFNNTTGAQSLQFIGATGTGITVANGKRATIYADGTNIVRATADV